MSEERTFQSLFSEFVDEDKDAGDTFVENITKEASDISTDTEDAEIIKARAFNQELDNLGIFEKLGVGTEVVPANPDAIPKVNPSVELSNQDRPEDEALVQAVIAKIDQLRAGSNAGGGTVESAGHEAQVAPRRSVPTGAPPTAYDAVKGQLRVTTKTAADRIVGTIYDHYFGGE